MMGRKEKGVSKWKKGRQEGCQCVKGGVEGRNEGNDGNDGEREQGREEGDINWKGRKER